MERGTGSADRGGSDRLHRRQRRVVFSALLALVVAIAAAQLTQGVPAFASSKPQAQGALTYGLRPGFPKSWDTTEFTPPKHDATFSTVGVGDLVVVYFHTYSITSHVESVQDADDRIAWHTSASVVDTYPTHTERLEMWIGTVTSVGTTTLTATWSGATTDLFIYAWEFSSSAGASATWSVTASGSKNNGTTGPHSVSWPALTSGATGGIWVGTAYPGDTHRDTTTVTGYTYFYDEHTNPLVDKVTLAADTTPAPGVGYRTTPRWYASIAMIVKAAGTSTVPSSLVVAPTPSAIKKGAAQQYSATAEYSNGSTTNVTTEASWSSSGTAVATVSSTGLASGVGGGHATITATYDGVPGAASLAVLPSEPAISAVGSATTYPVLHALFPTTLDDLGAGFSTPDQVIATTPQTCNGGVSYSGTSGAPNGSAAGIAALVAEQSAAVTKKGCITFARSSTPPTPATASASLDYYAFGLAGFAPLTGANAGGTRSVPASISLTQLRKIYSCWTSGNSTIVDTWKQAGVSTSTTVINRFWPQTGSGPQVFFKDMLGFTPAKTHAQTAKVHCTTVSTPKTKGPALQRFASRGTAPVAPNAETGLLYANSLSSTSATFRKITNDLYVYPAGRFAAEWNTRTNFNRTQTNSLSGTAIGNFVRTVTPATGRVLRIDAFTSTTGISELFVNFLPTTATPHPTGLFSVNPNVINESDEWFSHIPSNSSATTASSAAVPGVTYVYDVADTALPNFDAAKLLIGFDNQRTGATGTMCHGDRSTTITAAGLLPLSTGRTAPSGSDLAGADCREFPGGSYPGLGGSRSLVSPTWVAATT